MPPPMMYDMPRVWRRTGSGWSTAMKITTTVMQSHQVSIAPLRGSSGMPSREANDSSASAV